MFNFHTHTQSSKAYFELHFQYSCNCTKWRMIQNCLSSTIIQAINPEEVVYVDVQVKNPRQDGEVPQIIGNMEKTVYAMVNFAQPATVLQPPDDDSD